jgi:hypothetical protein
VVFESQAMATGAVNMARPPGSVAVRSPAASVATFRPRADTPAFIRVASLGLAAAAAVLTTNTSLKPPCSVAVTTRSVPGRTLLYVAVAPEIAGAGRTAGRVRESCRPPRVSTASGLVPPPESTRLPVVAVGE